MREQYHICWWWHARKLRVQTSLNSLSDRLTVPCNHKRIEQVKCRVVERSRVDEIKDERRIKECKVLSILFNSSRYLHVACTAFSRTIQNCNIMLEYQPTNFEIKDDVNYHKLSTCYISALLSFALFEAMLSMLLFWLYSQCLHFAELKACALMVTRTHRCSLFLGNNPPFVAFVKRLHILASLLPIRQSIK